MAHKKGEGSTQNNRDSQSKRLGIKLYGGQTAKAGSIIIRQRGLRYGLGENVYIGKDFTVHAMIPGKVMFKKGKDDKTIVYIQPFAEVAETVATVKGAKPAKAAAAPKAKAPAKAAAPAKAVAATPAPAAKAAVVETVVEAAPAVEAVVAETAAAPAAVVVETAAAAPAAVETATKSDDDDFSFDSIEAAFDEPAAEPVVAKAAATGKPDDLTKIEGIGPKIAELFHNEGIHLFSELANTPVERMREILDAAGPRYRIHEPATWAQQANLAATGQWAELKELQDRLDGGKEG
jgi:large subunit ribosomal protein L27